MSNQLLTSQNLRLHQSARRHSAEQRGATAVEYALMITLIATAVVGAVAILGGSVSDAYDSVVGTF